ncbi:S1C family serine protease [Rubritalea spongiae]|uniref:S1C family serine protease n=1 Tax=Rubritalea spongiae TaxID=430797 RepID=A0ABW5E219_9BACT
MKFFGTILCLCASLSCSQILLFAGPALPSDERTNGKSLRPAFAPQQTALQDSSAVLYDGWFSFNYGIVVSEDGYILAKESELAERESVSVRIGEIHYTEVKVIARNPRWDLALLKVEASNLTPIRWAESSALPQGSWVVANGATSRYNRRINVGIISAKSRAVDGLAPVVLGIQFTEDESSLVVDIVTKDTGAELAGLKKGDAIKKFDGVAVMDRNSLIDLIRDKIPGDVAAIEFERDEEIFNVEVELMARNEAYADTHESRNDAMSGDFSKRRDAFPRILQTDIPFNARTIGGPLLNLDGECIGMNIARANRAESFAIPVEELREELAEMLPPVQ